MSRPVTPALGMRPGTGSLYGDDIPGVANLDGVHGGIQEGGYLSGGLQDNEDLRDGRAPSLQRSNSQMSQSRSGTLKKKASLHRGSSLKRSGSRKSSYAGSVRSLRVGEKDRYQPEEYHSAFYCPVPTAGSPTELLANRFQAWRKVLKDLITYFRDLHKSYDSRSKTLLSSSNVINNTTLPADFLQSQGLGEATEILREFHKLALSEAQKARDLENEVIMQLTGLRSDLSQKIKEIKSLSGDFKNSVGKEQDQTKKAVNAFQEAVGSVDHDASAASGSRDPFIMKLNVERQLDRQIEEENYLHRAFLNLEASGRELESIVVGEIQKAYAVLAGIMKRDADANYDTAEKLREGPLSMTKDHEWDSFVTDNEHMVNPREPLRQVDQITYPGKNHPAALDVKSGMLERKSKYLKNYTPGWYVLSPTHLHEFKSADQISYQQPLMSLYLPEQKLGSHSEQGSSSNKFMLKGRQTGSMHRGHTWIFRAETHDTMMAWYSDIKELTEKRGEERNEFVRRNHARSISQGSVQAASVSSGDSQMGEDEADKVAFSSEQSVRGLPLDSKAEAGFAGAAGVGAATATAGGVTDDGRSEAGWRPPQQRPKPGGRFPSEVNVNRGLQAPLSPSSGDSGEDADLDTMAQAQTLPGSVPFTAAGVAALPAAALNTQEPNTPIATSQPMNTAYTAGQHPRVNAQPGGAEVANDTQSTYQEWMGTMAAGAGGAAAGVGAATANDKYRQGELANQGGLENEPQAPFNRSGHRGNPTVIGDQETSMAAVPQTQVNETATGTNTSSIARGVSIGATDIRPAPTTTSTTTTGAIEDASSSGAVPALQYSSTDTNPALPAASSNSTLATTHIGTDVGENSGKSPIRPPPVSAKSVQTISDLHIPGEFPTNVQRA